MSFVKIFKDKCRSVTSTYCLSGLSDFPICRFLIPTEKLVKCSLPLVSAFLTAEFSSDYLIFVSFFPPKALSTCEHCTAIERLQENPSFPKTPEAHLPLGRSPVSRVSEALNKEDMLLAGLGQM